MGTGYSNLYSTSSLKDINDFSIYCSLGTKALNYNIEDRETGEVFNFAEGTRVHNTEVFAGKGTRHPLNTDVSEGLTREFGGNASNWQHIKGIGTVDYNGEDRQAEVHWFQEPSVGKVKFKIKRWLE